MNKKQIIGLVVTVAIIAMAVVILILVTGSKEDGGEQNLNSNVTNNSVVNNNNNEINSNQNNKYDVITEDVVRNHNVTPISEFTYAEIAGGIEIRNYNGNDDIVVIPETINGQNVISISGYVFANESQVKGAYIPNTVKEIGATFANNKNLEVVVCEGVEVIRASTFLNCTELTNVILGDRLKELGDKAFAGCTKLNELYIASSLNNIDESSKRMMFYRCSNLTLHGEAGSYIETFAREQNIPFVAE